MKKKFLSFILAMVLFVGTLSTSAFATTTTPTLEEVNAEVIKTANYIATELRKDGGDNELDIYKYQYIFYLQRSGIECSDLVKEYLDLVAQNITDGKLLIDDTESSGFYAAVLLIMKLANVDATNFNGVNLVEKFEACVNAEDYSTYSYNASTYSYPYNPIFLAYAVFATEAYSDKMSYPDTILDKLKDGLLNTITLGSSYDLNPAQADFYGVDYYGINPDNNAKVLSALKYFYDTDSIVKSTVDNVITWTKSRINTDGRTLYGTTDYYSGDWITYTSSSSTGLTLALLANYNDADTALSYQGAMTYKSTTTQGAMDSGYGDDFDYGTRDIMEGLLSYSVMLSGSTNIYDVTDVAIAGRTDTKSIVALGYNPVNNPSDLPANSTLSFAQVSSVNGNYTLIANSLNGIAKSFVAFDFSLITGAVENHNILGTPISLTLTVPDGFENPTIYYVDDQGTYTKMESTVANGKITFSAPHFSTYVIVNEIKAASTVTTTPPATTDTTAIMTYYLFAVLSLATIIVLKKRSTVN